MLSRRSLLTNSMVSFGAGAIAQAGAQLQPSPLALVSPKDNLKITKLETFVVGPGFLFLKIHTNAGITGLGEPYVERRLETGATAIKEAEAYLIGRDPRHITFHWQNLYRNTTYHGGPVLMSVIGGIDHALWDIKGKALGVPVYELLGGPTRNRIRIYKNAGDVQTAKQVVAAGFTAVKVQSLPFMRFLDNPANIGRAAEHFAEMRNTVGDNIDLAVDFHGGISPPVSKILIKSIERYQPAWIEDPVQCENVDALAEVARSTYLPMCVGERLGTKWTVREVLEKRAAGLLNPDIIHVGGITEMRLYAGLAETYYIDIAPHVPLGPIALAASIQIAASIPNFLMTEHTTLGEGYFKKPFVVRDGYVDLPTAPGLGVELDEEALADKLGKEHGPGENFDPYDGAPVDR